MPVTKRKAATAASSLEELQEPISRLESEEESQEVPSEPLPEKENEFDSQGPDELPSTMEASEAAPPQASPGNRERLKGDALLEFFHDCKRSDWNLADIVREAGYVATTVAGVERLQVARFNAALLAAQHMIEEKPSGLRTSHAGKHRARVTGVGTLLLSRLAMQEVNAGVGDIFNLTYVGDGSIVISPTGENSPVKTRNRSAEQPGTPLLDQAAESLAAQ